MPWWTHNSLSLVELNFTLKYTVHCRIKATKHERQIPNGKYDFYTIIVISVTVQRYSEEAYILR